MEWVLHLTGVVLWVGGMMAAGLVRGPEVPGLPSTQRRILMTLALPGLILVVLTGVGNLFHRDATMDLGGWFHVKMTLAVALIVLQVLMTRARVRGVWVTPVVLLLGLGAIAMAHLKPF